MLAAIASAKLLNNFVNDVIRNRVLEVRIIQAGVCFINYKAEMYAAIGDMTEITNFDIGVFLRQVLAHEASKLYNFVSSKGDVKGD